MPLGEVQEYRQDFSPRLCDVLPLGLVNDLMQYFYWSTQRGIAFVIRKSDGPSPSETVENSARNPPKREEWGDFYFYGDDMGGTQNAICAAYKAVDGTERPRCRESDATIFMKCEKTRLFEPASFTCWLGLEECAHCLTIDGKVRAVLISGQQPPARNTADVEIEAAIEKNRTLGILDDALAAQLKKKVPEAISQKPSDEEPQGVVKNRLAAVTHTLQLLSDRLVRAHRAKAYGRLLSDISDHLTMAADVDPSSLWLACDQALEIFCEIVGLRQISVFARSGGQYVCKSPCLRPDSTGSPIGSPVVFEGLKRDHLEALRPDGCDGELWAAFSMNGLGLEPRAEEAPTVQVYRHDTKCPEPFYAPDVVEGYFSTVMVLVGQTNNNIDLEGFCAAISLRLAVAGLSARMLKSQEEYNQHVRRVAHAIRTPLQCTYLDLESAARMPELAESIEESRCRLYDASEDLTFLVEESQARRSTFDLPELLGQVMDALHPLAVRYQVTVVRWQDWPTSVVVEANRDAIRRGIQAIVENGIKYSYRHKEVRIQMAVVGDCAKIVVSNYGIGIPRETIDALLEGADGVRAKVPDDGQRGRRREGTGTGVATARDALRKDGGDLIITSEEKADARIQEYHRWLTRVTAYLPLHRPENVAADSRTLAGAQVVVRNK